MKGGKLVIRSRDESVPAMLETAGVGQLLPIMFDRGRAIAAVRR